ncbi:putative disease resistance protein RGA3 [Abrus precatorius]|uniref:Disease resistance protein RGA3 n=1 Tax=Abrus precatorius TaxID=3816 RepID=A0A8B8KQX7_ABRPR|nr:putative disease resistance protein RGA3 [Abrus precatorius]
MPILKLSYQNLSPEMRQCFAYCSLYPKDSKIYKNELIQLWMAQGYLKCSTKKQHMEDVGNKFVKIFLMNSFFQEAEKGIYGEIISFKMHDLMHDLAMFVAGNDYCYLDSKAERVEGRPMHVSLESKAIHLLNSLDASRLRTLMLWSYTEENLSVVSNLKYLRILKMSPSSLCKLSSSVGRLKHLRYLDMSCKIYPYKERQISLPKSISNLIFLQTLKLYEWDKEFFHDSITKLVNLRCLDVGYLPTVTGRMTLEHEDGMVGLGKLSSLQFLSTFVVGNSQERKHGTLNELKDLNLRGHLEIKHLNWVREVALESQDVNLKEKSRLQSLHLNWSDEKESGIHNSDSLQLLESLQPHRNLKQLKVYGYPGVVFSDWLSFLTNIVDISLFYFHNCRYLPPLERLPYLKSLEIRSLYELECIYLEDGSAVTFPSLEILKLRFCPKLRGWWRRGDDINYSKDSHNLSIAPSFPRLSELQISYCPKLTCLPTFPNIKDLYLRDCGVEPYSNPPHSVYEKIM